MAYSGKKGKLYPRASLSGSSQVLDIVTERQVLDRTLSSGPGIPRYVRDLDSLRAFEPIFPTSRWDLPPSAVDRNSRGTLQRLPELAGSKFVAYVNKDRSDG